MFNANSFYITLVALCNTVCLCFQNVFPNPYKSCGPYHPADSQPAVFLPVIKEDDHRMRMTRPSAGTSDHHDTLGIVALDVNGNVAGGTTTNGARFKIPGCVTAILFIIIW